MFRVIGLLFLFLQATPALASSYFYGAAGGVVAAAWQTNQILQMPYVCNTKVWINPSTSPSLGAGGGKHAGSGGTGSQAAPFLSFSDLYASHGNVTVSAGSCIYLVNSTADIDDSFDVSQMNVASQSGFNAPNGYHTIVSVDGNGNPVPAAGVGVTPDTVNTAAAHIKFSLCGACSATAGDPTYFFFIPPWDYWIIDGLNIEGVGGFLSQSFQACIDDGNPPLVNNGVSGLSHFQVRNSYIHGCGGAGIAGFGADRISIQNNVITNTSGAPGYQESGIGIVVSQYPCAGTYSANCAPNNTGVDSQLCTVVHGACIPFREVVSGNWVEGNFEFGQPPNHSDGNGIIFDTLHIRATDGPGATNSGAYMGPVLMVNNIALHNGARGLHTFFSDNVYSLYNTAYANSFDPLSNAYPHPQIDCAQALGCIQVGNVAYAIGAASTVHTAYTGGITGPVEVDNVNGFIYNYSGAAPGVTNSMPIQMNDGTANSITGVTIDQTNVSNTPGGISGQVTFSGNISAVNGALGASISPTTPFGATSSWGMYAYAVTDAGSIVETSCYPAWVQVSSLPCVAPNVLSSNMNEATDAWYNNVEYAINYGVGTAAIGGAAFTDQPNIVQPTVTGSPGFNQLLVDPLFTNKAFTITPEYILGGLASAPSAAGSNYSIGCLVTLSGGSPITSAIVKVDSINGSGGILTYHLWDNGTYSASVVTNFTQGSATCSGTGATFSNGYYYQPFWLNSSRPNLSLQSGSPAKHAGSSSWCISHDFAGNVRACPPSAGAYE